MQLMGPQVVALLAVGVLLTVSLLGAVVLASAVETENQKEDA
jgi:hypothetical protein